MLTDLADGMGTCSWSNDMTDEPDAIERKIRADVAQYGWHAMGVLDTAAAPGWTYSIGLYRSYGHPEVVVCGLGRDGFGVLADVVRQIRTGQRFAPGDTATDLLTDDRPCRFLRVDAPWYPVFFGRALDFYGGSEFPVLQCVWSDEHERYPWEAAFDPRLRRYQPALSQAPVDLPTQE
jgi:hypothetical protein